MRRWRHDGLLDGPDLILASGAIELSDLDPAVPGQILYNYVHRSHIGPAEKAGSANPRVWRPIVQHRRFSPRVIEETLRLVAPGRSEVAAEILGEPERVAAYRGTHRRERTSPRSAPPGRLAVPRRPHYGRRASCDLVGIPRSSSTRHRWPPVPPGDYFEHHLNAGRAARVRREGFDDISALMHRLDET